MSFKSRRLERDILRWLIIELGGEVPGELQEKETVFRKIEKFFANDINSILVIMGLIFLFGFIEFFKFISSFYQ